MKVPNFSSQKTLAVNVDLEGRSSSVHCLANRSEPWPEQPRSPPLTGPRDSTPVWRWTRPEMSFGKALWLKFWHFLLIFIHMHRGFFSSCSQDTSVLFLHPMTSVVSLVLVLNVFFPSPS